MIKVASLPISVDLQHFSQTLLQQGLDHRINEESGHQVIWAHSETEAELIRRALLAWSQQEVRDKSQADNLQGRGFDPGLILLRGITGFRSSPFTWLLVLVCAAVAVLSALGERLAPVAGLFYPLLPSDSLLALLAGIDSPRVFLRTLTPMFLHFGELHLIFNMLWLWYFGKQLEALQPRWLFCLLVIVTAFVSNTTQYLAIAYNNFGGMSGVVYGLVGYAWVIHAFMPRSGLLLNNTMFVFFVVALVAMEVLASSLIATAAHVSGLVSGLIMGLLVVAFYRLVLKREVMGKSALRE